ncbi:MAG: YceI family protein [Candidatus Eremiobacteraeota bacterium]|nr:YceI family protein [Candidatus Eremiobacteraeota bacterium]
MKTVALVALSAALAATPQFPRAIDPARSHASFSVQHIWVERVTGVVPILSGSVTLAQGSKIPTSVQAVLDSTSVHSGEPDRDRSLESPDFFDSQRYPQWTFGSTRIVPRGNDAFEMDGDLTIHGVTQLEHVNVTIGGTASEPVYHGMATIDRHAFGMATTRLEPAIGARVDVTLDIVLK